MAYQGKFKAKNPQKYRGDANNIIYRSRWELMVMQKLDNHPDVLEWASEEMVIPYISPIDGRRHRYFPDFVVKRKGVDGVIETLVIEIKPFSQTKPPARQDKPTRRYITEVQTWGVNSAKWEMARKFCEQKGWKFVVVTEKDLNLRF